MCVVVCMRVQPSHTDTDTKVSRIAAARIQHKRNGRKLLYVTLVSLPWGKRAAENISTYVVLCFPAGTPWYRTVPRFRRLGLSSGALGGATALGSNV